MSIATEIAKEDPRLEWRPVAERREKWMPGGPWSGFGPKKKRAFAEARLRARAVYTGVFCLQRCC
ncbi:hypothetical protein HPB50_001905 [Hyalomma asiaticum]|uniref:Uncharacterized protein n=1 Tax=Hyalomma asiaticum TaxID=266040 RepID=A0ACB7TDH9_HYAAI|nr:hypothetical protein HPB50_001905 [Hyalomma asiaticum]